LQLCLDVGRRAARQIREASDWWYENRPAAPDLFKTELGRAFELITSRPLLGAPSAGVRTKDVRRVFLGSGRPSQDPARFVSFLQGKLARKDDRRRLGGHLST